MLLTLRFIINYIFHSNIKADKVTTHNVIGVVKQKLTMSLAGQKEKINYERRLPSADILRQTDIKKIILWLCNDC